MKQSLLKKGVAAAALLLSFNNAWAQDPCSGDGPGCQAGGGDFLMTSEFDHFEPNKGEGFFVAVGSKSTSKIDTTYSGSFTITKLNGPGDITGTPLSGPFVKWAFIPDFTFTAPGMYEIEIDVPGIGKDTLRPDIQDGSGGGGGGTGGES